ncbi:MAG: GNAT family N-acetyltransferase [Cyclobacteriaceae bacterium]
MSYHLIIRTPSIEEYNEMRSLAGWPTFESALVKTALSNTLFSVCVEDGNNLVGMGRVVGDNAIYLHIQDVIVHPDFQRKGIGKLIMEALLKYADQVAGTNTNIGLMCSKGREEFYTAFGFSIRPSDKFGAGMIMIKESAAPVRTPIG